VFDDNSLRDLQAKMQQAYQAVVKQIDTKFATAFDALPDKIRKAFDTKTVKDFRDNVSDIATDFKKMEKSAEEIQKKNEILDDLASKLQISIQKALENLGKQNQEEQELIKALKSKAKIVDDMLEADEYAHELASKNLQQQQDLLKIEKLITNAQQVAQAKKAEYIALQEQQYRHEQMNIVSSQVFGVSLNKIRDKSEEIVGLWKNTSVWTKVAIGVGMIGKQLIDGFSNARSSGNDAIQAFGSTWSAALASLGGMSKGIFAGVGTSAANQGALQNILGTTEIPKELTEQANKLTTQYGFTSQEAAHLLGFMQRINHFQTQTTEGAANQVQHWAHIAKLPVGTLMQELNASTQEWAQYADRGADAFARSVGAAQRMNTTVAVLGGMMDNVVDDFSHFLESQAQIQTILPGVNLSKYAFAAQFGTPEQAGIELKKALNLRGITDFSQISPARSIRNLFARGIGVAPQTIEGILNPTPEPKEGPENEKNWLERLADKYPNLVSFLNSTTGFVTGLGAASAALTVFTASTIAAAIANGGGRLLGGLAKITGISKAFSMAKGLFTGGGIAAEAAGAGEGLATGAGAAAGGLMATLALPIAAVAGGSMLSSALMRPIIDKMTPAEQMKFNLGNSVPGLGFMAQQVVMDVAKRQVPSIELPSSQASATQATVGGNSEMDGGHSTEGIVLDTKKLEVKLDSLIREIKNMKFTVNLDSRKVGDGIIEAFSHG
jgi:hypothetical protein